MITALLILPWEKLGNTDDMFITSSSIICPGFSLGKRYDSCWPSSLVLSLSLSTFIVFVEERDETNYVVEVDGTLAVSMDTEGLSLLDVGASVN